MPTECLSLTQLFHAHGGHGHHAGHGAVTNHLAGGKEDTMDMHTHAGHEGHAHHSPKPPVGAPILKDPVCGMTVTDQSPHRTEHDGSPYYFCSAKCLAKFSAEPEKYLQPPDATATPPSAAEAASGTLYTCPMHPEIRQDHPGNCPKCGMSLEPVLPDLDETDNPELVDFQRRFWWTLPLTAVVTVLAMFGHRLAWFDMATQSWIELVLTLPIALWAGRPFFVRGAQSIVNRSPNMWTLISLGTGAAFLYSVVATVAPQVFPESFVSMGRVAVYFEAAAVIISLTLAGSDPRTEGALADLGRHTVAARAGPQDGAPHCRGRQRGGRASLAGACRRPTARAPG